MNEDFMSKNRNLLYISFLIITIITFYPLFFTGIACGDDLQNYLVARWGNFMKDAGDSALIAGRFYYYIVKPLNSLPYIYDNIYVTKLFQIIPLIVCFLLFSRILFIVTRSKELSFLYFLMVLVLFQISGYTSLFVTYPFYYTFSFSLLLWSYLLLWSFLKNQKRKFLFYSALLFAFGLLFYETYLFFLLIFGFTILSHHLKDDNTLREKLKSSFLQFLPFLCLAILYLCVYFLFRLYHPSKYDGTSFASSGITFHSFFNVLWSLSYTSFPLSVFESSREIFYTKSELIAGHSPVVIKIILNARVEWLIKGFLVALCGYLILIRIPKIKPKTLMGIVLFSVLLVFTPHIPLALTPKYTFYTSVGMIGYVTTFFSLFGVLLLIVFLLGYLMNLASIHPLLQKIVAFLLIIVLFVFSVLTDYSNNAIAKDIRSANLRFYAMDELMKTEMFRSIPNGSNLFTGDLYTNPSFSARNLTEQSFNWSSYIDIKTGINQEVFKNEKDFLVAMNDTTRQSYYLTLQQAVKDDDIAIVLAKIRKSAPEDTVVQTIVDKAWVLYYSPYKIFSVSFACKDPSMKQNVTLKINHIKDSIPPGKTIDLTIFNTQRSHIATFFSIQAESIDLKSIRISNLVNPGSKVFYL
jgi:hypothetical protein